MFARYLNKIKQTDALDGIGILEKRLDYGYAFF